MFEYNKFLLKESESAISKDMHEVRNHLKKLVYDQLTELGRDGWEVIQIVSENTETDCYETPNKIFEHYLEVWAKRIIDYETNKSQ